MLLFTLVVGAFVAGMLAGPWGLPALAVVSGTPSATANCQPFPPATPAPQAAIDETVFLDPTPTPAPDPEAVVDPRLEAMTVAAAANLEACWDAADWDAVGTILTPRFLETAFGIDAPDMAGRAAAIAALDFGPVRIETIGPVAIWNDGRGAVEVRFQRGRGHPAQTVAARWFFLAERGVVRFDAETLLPPPPLGDRVTVGFSIADDVQPLRWDGVFNGHLPVSPVTALHGTNRGLEAHTFVLAAADGSTLAVLTLPAWEQADLVLLDLPPGTYRLHDPAVAGSELTIEVASSPGVRSENRETPASAVSILSRKGHRSNEGDRVMV